MTLSTEDQKDLDLIIGPKNSFLAKEATLIAPIWTIFLVIVLSGIGGMIVGFVFALLAGAISWLFGASDPREIALMWFVGVSIISGFIRLCINIMNMVQNAKQPNSPF